MVVKGGVTVSDRCGILGKTYQNPTIAIPPGGLSSMKFAPGYGTYSHYINVEGGASTTLYDPAQPSSCQTYGFGVPITTSFWYTGANNKATWTSSTGFTLGPPYMPILSPPSQLLSFDPAWRGCPRWENSYGGEWGLLTCMYLPLATQHSADIWCRWSFRS